MEIVQPRRNGILNSTNITLSKLTQKKRENLNRTLTQKEIERESKISKQEKLQDQKTSLANSKYIKKKEKLYVFFFKLFKKTEEKKFLPTQFMKKALCWSHNQTRISQKRNLDKHLQKYSMKD